MTILNKLAAWHLRRQGFTVDQPFFVGMKLGSCVAWEREKADNHRVFLVHVPSSGTITAVTNTIISASPIERNSEHV